MLAVASDTVEGQVNRGFGAVRDPCAQNSARRAAATSDTCHDARRDCPSLRKEPVWQHPKPLRARWRFEPGRPAGASVDVLVAIMLDFSIR